MPEQTPQQKRKADKALKILREGDAAIVEHLVEIEDKFDESIAKVEANFEKAVSAVRATVPDLKSVLAQVRGEDGHTPTDEELLTLINPLIPTPDDGHTPTEEELLTLIRPLIPVLDLPDERLLSLIKPLIPVVDHSAIALEASARAVDELSPLIPTIDEIEKDLPKLGPYIRDSLELLKDEDRLDISAIRGVDKRDTVLTDYLIQRAIGIVDSRTSFLINKVSNLQDQFNRLPSSSGGGHTIQDEGTPLTQRTNLNFVGAGVTVTDDAGNNATKVTISTSGGAGFQQPSSGSINGSNAIFVWATEPNAIVVDNGRTIQKVSSDGTINWTGTTTTTLSIAPTFDLFAVA